MSELPELIQALYNPQAYPEPPSTVELVQTQISYVFLAGDLVYKIKKPVDFGFLDYTTLEKRFDMCTKEVELNRRLCKNTYLGVVPVTLENGRYIVGGPGEAVEYAVKMRRLPQEAMLDNLLIAKRVTPEMITEVAGIMADFHRRATTSPEIAEIGGINAVIKNTSENFEQTAPHIGTTISSNTYRKIKEYTEDFIITNRELFLKRMADGRIRDCHGDLHAAHVCFHNGICIYDCIEFIDRLRYTDVVADIAFLAMDLDRYQRPDLAEIFVNNYVKLSGDMELMELLGFYKCYRAYVRGKIGCSQYEDPHIPESEKGEILATTHNYFRLAESYIK